MECYLDNSATTRPYKEVVDIVRIGKSAIKYIDPKNFYEGHIDPTKGDDWNQSAPVDTRPTLSDFRHTVADYLAWEVSNLLKNKKDEEDGLGKF